MPNATLLSWQLAQAAVSYEGTFTTQRVQHAALETHGGLAWVEFDLDKLHLGTLDFVVHRIHAHDV